MYQICHCEAVELVQHLGQKTNNIMTKEIPDFYLKEGTLCLNICMVCVKTEVL